MDFRTEPTAAWARILALVSLAIGLTDAARLLGLGTSVSSPIDALGISGFIVLTLLCVMRLFAAVGLWIQVRWGALLLLASLVIELVLHLTGSGWVTLTLLGFIFKLATMLATIALVALAQLVVQRHIVDR